MTNKFHKSNLLTDGPSKAPVTIVLAHGAGSGMGTEFMNVFASGLAGHGFRVVRFEFAYMSQRRETGKRRPPDREPLLREAWLSVVNSFDSDQLVIGGKSMGGRIASLIADEAHVAGLICLGYPFHPIGKPKKLRTEHLKSLQTSTLILQGERDSMGRKEEVSGYKLSNNIRTQWLTDGDHSFKPRKTSGRTQEQNWQEGIEIVAEFILSLKTD